MQRGVSFSLKQALGRMGGTLPNPPPGSATGSQSVLIETVDYGTSRGLCDKKIGPASIF